MGVGAGLYMYVVVVQKFTFAISSPDEFLLCMLVICLVHVNYAVTIFPVTYFIAFLVA